MNLRTIVRRRLITLVMLFALLCSFGVTAQAKASSEFDDVSADAWYYEYVTEVVKEGIFNGVDANHFAPDGNLKRAMLVTALWRLEGSPLGYSNEFTDVKAGSYYYDAVAWATSCGIVNGFGDNIFKPDDMITRNQMVTIIYRYANYTGYDTSARYDLSGYKDAGKVQSYAQEAMQWAVAEKMMVNCKDALRPQELATRAEAAACIAKLLDKDEGTHTGTNGKSAYELAVENGYEGTVQEWLASLAGKNGTDGKDGKSAYELAVENGYVGTEVEWLRSLAGSNGKSAYELAVDNGYTGTELEWLASLVGEAGANGKDGASAYEVAVSNGYKGTETEWLSSLIGPTGAKGTDGKDGTDGVNGLVFTDNALEGYV